MTKGIKITIWFIALALTITIIYDILALTQFNVDATISRVVYWWSEYSFLFKYLFVAGVNFLMGHLLWGQRVTTKATKELFELLDQSPPNTQAVIIKYKEIKEGK